MENQRKWGNRAIRENGENREKGNWEIREIEILEKIENGENRENGEIGNSEIEKMGNAENVGNREMGK